MFHVKHLGLQRTKVVHRLHQSSACVCLSRYTQDTPKNPTLRPHRKPSVRRCVPMHAKVFQKIDRRFNFIGMVVATCMRDIKGSLVTYVFH
jgi:hypothetical protein